MKVVIDARLWRQSGIGRYLRNLTDGLQKLDKENEYFLLLLKEDYHNLVFNNNFNKVLGDFNWYTLAEQVRLPKILDKLRPDLVHFPHFNVPILYKGKFVVTIHDLLHQHFQMRRATTLNPIFYKVKTLGYKKVFNFAVDKSTLVIVPSKFVKRQLVDEWKLSQEKIVVTYEAVDDSIISLANHMSKKRSEKILSDLLITSSYLYYIGSAHPHKNVEGLIQAFLMLKSKYPKLSLVLSGYDHFFWERLKIRYQDEKIIFTGYVTDEQMVALYKNALCFVMPSFEEGFGIPILEAMACGTAVVSSNAKTLIEIADKAAYYFDPKDLNDINSKISRVIEDVSLKEKLKKLGEERFKQFNWQKLAKQTLEVYRLCTLP